MTGPELDLSKVHPECLDFVETVETLLVRRQGAGQENGMGTAESNNLWHEASVVVKDVDGHFERVWGGWSECFGATCGISLSRRPNNRLGEFEG
jgi:hypothetical protein